MNAISMVHKMQRLTMNNSNVIAKKEQSYPVILEDAEGGDEGEGIQTSLCCNFCSFIFLFIYLFFCYFPLAFFFFLF